MITFDDTREEHQHWRRNENTVLRRVFSSWLFLLTVPDMSKEQIKSLSWRRHGRRILGIITWLQNTIHDWNT
jgi:hypothetical protein